MADLIDPMVASPGCVSLLASLGLSYWLGSRPASAQPSARKDEVAEELPAAVDGDRSNVSRERA